MTNKEIKKAKEDLTQKRSWTDEQWKNGNDIERLVWFISTLSPHNLWKAQEAIESLLTQQAKQHKAELEEERKKVIEEIISKYDEEIEEM